MKQLTATDNPLLEAKLTTALLVLPNIVKVL